MKINIDVHLHTDSDSKIMAKLARILNAIQIMERNMATDLSDIRTKVQANSTVVGSAVTLLTGLKAQLDELAVLDPATLQTEIKKLAEELGADTQKLAAAVAANTIASAVEEDDDGIAGGPPSSLDDEDDDDDRSAA